VRNNFLRWQPGAGYAVDVGIYTVSPGSKVLHNTVLARGEYPSAIEVRYASTTGVEVRGNLLDAAVTPRDGAAPTTANNLTAAQPGWFVDEAAGDLRLTSAAAAAIDEVTRLADALDTYAAWTRPAGAGLADVGADEFEQLFRDGFESGDTAPWSASTPP
jgi:hypothetical protein